MESLEVGKDWTNRRVLVTGGTGLVGSRLVELLIQKNSRIAILVNEENPTSPLIRTGLINKCTTYYGSLAEYRVVEHVISDFEPEVVIHLGAQTIVGKAINNPKLTFESNIQGTWNLLEAVRINARDIQSILVASSDKAYGTGKTLPYDESFPLHGDGPYDVSKSCTDLIAQSYAITYGMPIAIARCGNIYGPGDCNWSRIVPGTIKSLFLNEQPILRSNGTNLRDYIYVDDVVAAYTSLAENDLKWQPGDSFNFSNDRAYSVSEIYGEICQVVKGGFVEPIILNSATSEIQDQHLTSAKAKQVLNWSSAYTLKAGLELTVPWYAEVMKEACV
jgi:CDP-glucose 4,6-dehydratase